jgi:hypothetical protein
MGQVCGGSKKEERPRLAGYKPFMRATSFLLPVTLFAVACGDDGTLAEDVFLTDGDYAPDNPNYDTNGCLLEGTTLVIGLTPDVEARTLTVPEGELLTVSTDGMILQVADDGSFEWRVSAIYTSTACDGDQCFECKVELRGQFDGQIVDSTSFELTNGALSVEKAPSLNAACEDEVKQYVAPGYSLASGCKSTFETRMTLAQ